VVMSALVVVPASIYLSMLGGGSLALASTVIIAILVSELSRAFGEPLTKQELLVTYEAASVISAANAAGIGFYWIIFRMFYVKNPLTWAFKIDGVPIPELVPSWLAPPLGSQAYAARTLFHPDLLAPELVYLAFTALYLVAELGIFMLLAYTFLEVERLPFPLSRVDVALVETLAVRGESVRYFAAALPAGIIYGIFVIALPYLAGITFVPLPWIDFTPVTEPYLPGAALGLATDMTPWVVGLILPLESSVSMAVGSLATWVLGNYLFLTRLPTVFPEWVEEYRQGMGIALIWQRSMFRVWLAPQIGASLALALAMLFKFRRSIASALGALLRGLGQQAGARYPRATWLAAMFLSGTLLSAVLHWYLTGFPLWISLLYSVGLSVLVGVASTVAMGETGFTLGLPYLWHTLVYFSGYKGYSGWVIMPVLAGTSAPGWVNMMSAAYLTETRPMDLVKAIVMAVVLTQVIGIVSLDFFWRIAPIPSSAYPYTLYDWARIAIGDSLLITRSIRLDPVILLSSAGLALVIIAGFEGARALWGAPLSGAGLVVGMMTLTPFAISILVSSLLSNLLLLRAFGRERWAQARFPVAAGMMAGYGVVTGLTVSAAFIAKASWIWPW